MQTQGGVWVVTILSKVEVSGEMGAAFWPFMSCIEAYTERPGGAPLATPPKLFFAVCFWAYKLFSN